MSDESLPILSSNKKKDSNSAQENPSQLLKIAAIVIFAIIIGTVEQLGVNVFKMFTIYSILTTDAMYLFGIVLVVLFWIKTIKIPRSDRQNIKIRRKIIVGILTLTMFAFLVPYDLIIFIYLIYKRDYPILSPSWLEHYWIFVHFFLSELFQISSTLVLTHIVGQKSKVSSPVWSKAILYYLLFVVGICWTKGVVGEIFSDEDFVDEILPLWDIIRAVLVAGILYFRSALTCCIVFLIKTNFQEQDDHHEQHDKPISDHKCMNQTPCIDYWISGWKLGVLVTMIVFFTVWVIYNPIFPFGGPLWIGSLLLSLMLISMAVCFRLVFHRMDIDNSSLCSIISTFKEETQIGLKHDILHYLVLIPFLAGVWINNIVNIGNDIELLRNNLVEIGTASVWIFGHTFAILISIFLLIFLAGHWIHSHNCTVVRNCLTWLVFLLGSILIVLLWDATYGDKLYEGNHILDIIADVTIPFQMDYWVHIEFSFIAILWKNYWK